jgi:TonB family protein
VTAPAEGSRSLKLTFPEKPIAVSSSFAITSQLSVLIAPGPGPAVTHHPARLQAGKLVSYVWPHYPKTGSRGESTETVEVLATIGKFGQVMDVKRVNGSSSLFAAAMSAIRQWHFQPTLLNERPVPALQDVTIEFRPPRYSSQVSSGHALPN